MTHIIYASLVGKGLKVNPTCTVFHSRVYLVCLGDREGVLVCSRLELEKDGVGEPQEKRGRYGPDPVAHEDRMRAIQEVRQTFASVQTSSLSLP